MAPPLTLRAGRRRGGVFGIVALLLVLATAAPARADDVWAGWGRHLASSVDPSGVYLSSITLGPLPIAGGDVDLATTDRLANGCLAATPGLTSTRLWCDVD